MQGVFHGLRERGQQVVAELAPAELAEKGAGGAPQARRLLLVPPGRSYGRLEVETRLFEGAGDGVPDLARRHLAPAQVRRETRAAFEVGPVAVHGVGAERTFEERVQTPVRAAFARPPDGVELGRPGPDGLGLELREREAGRGVRSRRKRLRRRQRLLRRRPREACAPERREHRVRASVAGPDGQRVGEQVGLADDDRLGAGRAQSRLEGAVVGELVGLEAFGPDHGAGARAARERGDGVDRFAALEQQTGTEGLEV